MVEIINGLVCPITIAVLDSLWLFGEINYSIKGSEPPLFYDAKFILNNLSNLLALQIAEISVY